MAESKVVQDAIVALETNRQSLVFKRDGLAWLCLVCVVVGLLVTGYQAIHNGLSFTLLVLLDASWTFLLAGIIYPKIRDPRLKKTDHAAFKKYLYGNKFERFMGSCVEAPISEEVLFRGLPWLIVVLLTKNQLIIWSALIFSGIVFALVHSSNWTVSTNLKNSVLLLELTKFPDAILFTIAFMKFGIWYAILLHALANLMVFPFVLLETEVEKTEIAEKLYLKFEELFTVINKKAAIEAGDVDDLGRVFFTTDGSCSWDLSPKLGPLFPHGWGEPTRDDKERQGMWIQPPWLRKQGDLIRSYGIYEAVFPLDNDNRRRFSRW